MKLARYIIFIALILPLVFSCATKPVEYSIHTDEQMIALNDSYSCFTLYAKGNIEKSKSEAITINNLNNDKSIILSSSYGEKIVDVNDGKAIITNPYIGTEYQWKGCDGGDNGYFTVSPIPPRNIDVDGVTNFRDLGGWPIQNGQTIKQGMLYRSARFSENKSGDALITEDGKKTVLEDLKIKTQIDLRETADGENGGLTASPIGESVNYISLPFKKGGGYLQQNLNKFDDLFEILANVDNYPLVFHCSIGSDRTGAIAFILEALLGVSDEDLYIDYLFSNFGEIGGISRQSAIDDYLALLNRYPGNNRSEQAIALLLDNGVLRENIESFMSIMSN